MALPELTTSTLVKSYLGISVTTWDTIIGTLVLAAEGWIRGYCNRPIPGAGTGSWKASEIGASVTEDFDGCWSHSLTLTYTPISSITSIAVKTGASSSVTVDSSSYRLDNANTGIVSMIGVGSAESVRFDVGLPMGGYGGGWANFPGGFRNVRVVYVGGYTTIPDDLSAAATILAAYMFQRRTATGAFQSEKLGDYSYTLAGQTPADTDAAFGGMPPDVGWMLQPFIRRNEH